MAITSQTWDKLTVAGIKEWFGDELTLADRDLLRERLFRIIPSTNTYEDFQQAGAQAGLTSWTGTVTYTDPAQGYSLRITPGKFAGGFQVTREMVEEDRYREIEDMSRDLALAAVRSREQKAIDVFNNAFAGTGGPDALSLCHNAHTTKASSATFNNLLTGALNDANLQTAHKTMRDFRNDRNEKISIVPDELLVPVDLEQTAFELIKSEGKVNTADNNRNIHFGRYTLYVSIFLTDANNWFLLDSKLRKRHLIWIERRPIEVDTETDFDAEVVKTKVTSIFGTGWSDWRFVIGSEVA